MARSFLDCPHKRVQDYTECCLDCGYNIYTTKEEYLKDLHEQLEAKGKDPLTRKIRAAEATLNKGNG
jgi:hypothetical protein